MHLIIVLYGEYDMWHRFDPPMQSTIYVFPCLLSVHNYVHTA